MQCLMADVFPARQLRVYARATLCATAAAAAATKVVHQCTILYDVCQLHEVHSYIAMCKGKSSHLARTQPLRPFFFVFIRPFGVLPLSHSDATSAFTC